MQQNTLPQTENKNRQTALQISTTVIHDAQLDQVPRYRDQKYQRLNLSHNSNLRSCCIACTLLIILFTFIALILSVSLYQSNIIYKLIAKTSRVRYNEQNKGTQLTKSNKYKITLSVNNTFDPLYGQMSSFGLQDTIQVGSILDFGVGDLIDFGKLEKDLLQDIAYELIQFDFDYSLQIHPGLLQITQFKNQKDMNNYISNLKYKQYNNSSPQQDQLYNLAIQMVRDPSNKANKQIQYYLADQKYQIGEVQTQTPICIFTTQRQLLSRNRFIQQYFQSIDAMNYTDFHIVYVDDYSNDGTLEQVLNYFQNTTSRIKNRVQIVHNLQRLGALANMFFWIKKFCKGNQIVVILDGDDTLVGRQGFKILNSVYKNRKIWYTYSSYLLTTPEKKFIFKGPQSQYLNIKTSQYRKSFKWTTSHLRTFRKKLMNSVPIQSLIQYHYNKSQRVAWPVFPEGASDLIITFALMELAGNLRITHIDQFLYNFINPANNSSKCYQMHVKYDDARCRIKTPLKPLKNIGDKPEKQQRYTLKTLSFFEIQMSYQSYRQNCLNQNNGLN